MYNSCINIISRKLGAEVRLTLSELAYKVVDM